MTKAIIDIFTKSNTTFTALLLACAAMPTFASLNCDSLKACDKKFCEIQKQLQIAEEKGNASKADGLEKALAKARLQCTDKYLRDELLDKKRKAEKDLADYEADLKEAKDDGDMDDIRKYQEKINEEKNSIKLLDNELFKLS